MKKILVIAFVLGVVWFAYHAFTSVNAGVQTVKAAAQTEQQELQSLDGNGN